MNIFYIRLIVAAILCVVQSNAARPAIQLIPENAGYDDRTSQSLSASPYFIVLSAIRDDDMGVDAGAIYVFYESVFGVSRDFSLQTKITPSNGQAGDRFGDDVDVEDRYIAVGAPDANAEDGRVYVYTATSLTAYDWESDETILTAYDSPGSEYLGLAVEFNGPLTILAGADFATGAVAVSGAIYAFTQSSDGARDWNSNQVKIYPASAGDYDWFGVTLATEGPYICSGSSQSDIDAYNAGRLYIFVETTEGVSKDWRSNEYFVANPTGGADDKFGYSSGISGLTVVTSTYGDATFEGVAYAFTQSAEGAYDWSSNMVALPNPTNTVDELFAFDVKIHDGLIVVGAYKTTHSGLSGAGLFYAYWESDVGLADWSPAIYQEMKHEDANSYDYFGRKLHLEADFVVVSAHFDDNNYEGDGIGHVFFRCNATLNPDTNRFPPCDCEGFSSIGMYCDLPCENGGSSFMSEQRATLDENGFVIFDKCTCTGDHFSGDLCDTSCNNGTAVNGMGVPNSCSCDGIEAVGQFCETPCANGGIAEEAVQSSLPEYDTCTCTDHFTGALCDKPCFNGFNDAGTCNCTFSGATGKFCTQDIDDCASFPCMNMGTCSDYGADLFPNHANEFNCTCAEGYYGPTCADTFCYSNPCLHNGTCENGMCNCTGTGYDGKLCETGIDDCASSPCMAGVCSDEGVNAYSCDCADTGKTGVNCEIEIDDCESSPCMNDGACKDKFQKYQCTCAQGFTGSDCETNIDDCLSSPCQNDGRCNDGILTFTCDCAFGWTGTICDIDHDDCLSMPCPVGNTCIDGFAEFSCEAPDPCLACNDTEVCHISDDGFSATCRMPISTSYTGLACNDTHVDCSTWFLTQLIKSVGGEAEDYTMHVVEQPDGLYDVDVVFDNPDGVKVAVLEDVFDGDIAVTNTLSSSIVESGTSMCTPASISLACMVAIGTLVPF